MEGEGRHFFVKTNSIRYANTAVARTEFRAGRRPCSRSDQFVDIHRLFQGFHATFIAPKPNKSERGMSSSTEFQRAWFVILASAVGVGVGLTGLPFYTFGVFINPLEDAYGWSRSAIAAGLMVVNGGTLLLSPVVGWGMDRFGAKWIAVPSLIGLALGLFSLSFAGPGLLSFYLAWFLVAVLGVGTTPLTWTRTITACFDRMRGLALGLTLLGTGVASMLGPGLVQHAISTDGWPSGFRAMAAFVLLVAVPLAVFGLPSRKRAEESLSGADPLGLSFGEAVRRPAFYFILCGIFFAILGQSAATVHFIPLMRGRGVDPAYAAQMMFALGLSVIIGRVCIGLLLDRVHAPLVARVCLLMPAIALALLYLNSDITVAWAAIILLGLAAGAEVDLLAYLVGRYFGLRSYGKIYGVMLSGFALGGGLGPILAGAAFDTFGNYDTAMISGMLIFAAAALLLGAMGRYPDFQKAS